MTSEEYDKLTDEEIQIKVAECANWERPTDGKVCKTCTSIDPDCCIDLPDYLYDLNACHGFEITMSRDEKAKYYAVLTWHSDGYYDPEEVVSATARQRCKAFCIVMTE